MTETKNKILCSTGTIIGGINNFDYTLIPEYAALVNCDGFEFMVEPIWTSEGKMGEIVDRLLPHGVNFETMHMDKDIGFYISKNEPGDIDFAMKTFGWQCEAAKKLGAKLLVLHLWSGPPSDKNMEVNIGLYPNLLEIAGRFNLVLTVEGVICSTYDPLTHMKTLYETYGDAMRFTFDVRHAEFHGKLKDICEADFLWENDLVPHFHIADWRGGYMDWSKLRPIVRPGEGDIDFAYLAGFIRKIGYKGSFTLEAGSKTETGIDFEKLNKSLDFIRDLVK